MAENKKSFILYANIIHTVKKLSKDQIADLFVTILEYVNDEDPEVNDLAVDLVFEPIKQQLKIDLKKWEVKQSKNSEAGRKGGLKSGEVRKNEANEANASTDLETKQRFNEKINEPVIDIVNDNVIVNDSVIESTGAHPLENSNLFRKPTIPTLNQVIEVFCRSGGNEEMAKKFYEKHSSVEWFLNGSPIKNFSALVPSFIQNWKKYQDGKTVKGSDSAKPGTVRAPC